MVAGTVVEADDGRTAHGIAHEHRHEQEGCVHDDTVGGHAVLTGQTQQLEVIQDIDQRHGKVGHQLGRAVDAGIPQDFAVKTGLAQVQAAGVAAVDEVEHRQYAAHQLADKGGNGRALHAPAPDTHHQHIQHHVGAACAHGEPEAEVRLFGGDEKALEHILQRKGGQGHHQDASIAHRIVQKLPLCAQQHGNGPQKHNAQHGQHTDRDQSRQQEQGEIAVGLFLVALAQRDAHDGAAAGAQHKADGAQQHGQRHDEVDRRKGRLAHKVGDTQAVHDAVDGGEQHGTDAGQYEPQKAGIGKVIGKLDPLLGHGVLLSAQGAKTGRINVRECTPCLDLLRHYGNETSGGALSARHLIRPVSNYVENGPPMNRKRAYQNLFLLSRQKNQKIGIRGSKFINCLFPTFIKPVKLIKVFLWIRKGELLF